MPHTRRFAAQLYVRLLTEIFPECAYAAASPSPKPDDLFMIEQQGKTMNTFLKSALAVAATAVASQAAAQITFYENEGFEGRSFTTTRQVANLDRSGIDNRASSVVVASNRWEVCEDAGFAGRCVVLRPGSYGSLAMTGLNNRITSVRAIGANARIDENRFAPLPAPAQITFYENENFQGRSFTTQTQVGDFRRTGFNDRASSVDVVGYRWEACENSRFGGQCVVLRPGRYPSLASMGINNRISSVRTVAMNSQIADNRYAPSPAATRDGRDYRRRNGERTYQVPVTSARAVVGTPEQRCWVEQEQVQAKPGLNTTGAVVGAVIGGILGHQIGDSNLATVGGAVAGGALGANVNRLGIGGQPATQTRDVQKCASVPSQAPTYWDVTYNFRGQDHRVQMTSQPGPTVTVNDRGEPRA
jgi:uncharacterized protein YcfJ